MVFVSAGEVILPLDLVSFEPALRPAVLRALGGHVIAATDDVAARLITRFGIPSVTPDGKVTSRGTMQVRGTKEELPVPLKPLHCGSRVCAIFVHVAISLTISRRRQRLSG